MKGPVKLRAAIGPRAVVWSPLLKCNLKQLLTKMLCFCKVIILLARLGFVCWFNVWLLALKRRHHHHHNNLAHYNHTVNMLHYYTPIVYFSCVCFLLICHVQQESKWLGFLLFENGGFGGKMVACPSKQFCCQQVSLKNVVQFFLFHVESMTAGLSLQLVVEIFLDDIEC